MADNTDAFTEIPKKYNSLEEEEKVLSFWKTNDVYKFVRNDQKKLYAIDTPPPTVSGNMHIGHSFSFSQQDFVARYKRLTGCNVFYPFGTDDNGLPTERLVEKKKGVKSTKMDRSDFVALCDATIKEIKDDFTSDWIRLGMSCDFNKSYSTIDKEVQTISQRSFIELFNKGLIYEKEAPMSWCPKCQTAIAQAEFESKDIKSTFNDIVFKSTEGDDLIIATTRPEFIPACVGIFAHPEDERYAHLKGKKAIVPLFNFEVPLYFDEAVEKDKGTGLMMVCTFGDKEDIEKWMRLNLDTRVILEKDGTLNDLAGKYKGMTCVEARAEILKDLDEAGHLKGQTEIVHAVNVHERDGVELEFLITKQWFVKVLEHKDMLLKEVDKITWHPDFMKKRMIHWIENLNWDWCISRQRHFGIPFPVWRHKETGELILPSVEELPVDPLKDVPKGYTKEEVVPETDVMDTWATSALTPILALERHGLSHDNLPMDLRPQAHDIIRTWAFYTMIRHKYELDTIPWKNIMISGYVLASKGEKMSKSKGNSVTPREVLAKYSADILRFWAAGSKLGEDLPYKEQDLDAGKRFVTKMWNSFKFLDFFLSQNPDFDPHSKVPLVTQDLWLLHKVDTLIEKNTKDFEKYEYDKVKYRTEQFFWTVFCDSYIEIVKDRLYKPEVYGVEAQQSGLYTYYHVFKALLTMVHPFVPFVTESIWQYGFRKFESELSIVDAAWPALFSEEATEQQILAGQLAIDITAALRKHKSDNKKSLNTAISLTLGVSEDIKTVLESVLADIKGTAKATEIILKDPKDLRKDIVLGEALSEETTVEADEEDTPKELGLVVMDVDFVEEST